VETVWAAAKLFLELDGKPNTKKYPPLNPPVTGDFSYRKYSHIQWRELAKLQGEFR
jgi:hypothetical protein